MRAVIADMPKRWLEERKTSEAAQWDEMWDGVLHMPPMPNRMHQDIGADLLVYLKLHWARPNGCRVNQEVNLTTPEDESTWTLNYRIPDMVLLTPDRFHIDRGEYMAGAPNVVVEIRSPGDESYEKLPFYAALGVPEVWVINRDTKIPEVFALQPGGGYSPRQPDAAGWLRSDLGIELRQRNPGKLTVRLNGDDGSAEDIPAG
jgi:Uma2 family endonuclease